MMFLICLSLLMVSCHGFLFDTDPTVSISGRPLPSQNFSYHAVLDNNYHLYWDFNDTHIIFETQVKTNGFVGFGISPNGGMKDSDVVIGWVKDGKSYFSDRHATGHYLPAVDASQDWFLLKATEVGNYTTLTMVRKLDTCDTYDRPILTGTTRVIYSYSPNDPVSETSIGYHGSARRGTKSLLLLDPSSGDSSPQKLPDNVITIDFLSNNYSVENRNTIYHSTTFKLRNLGQKHHMIRFEPVIQQGHEKLVHHIVLYSCTKDLEDRFVGISFDTDQGTPPEINGFCENVVIAWAVGGTAFNYPANVGHSLGTLLDPTYFRLEIHYDNPNLRSDYVDNSGIRIYLTTDLRQHDASVVMIGISPDENHIIPPFEKRFVTSGYCQADCIAGSIGDQEIRVFAVFLHAHLIGRQLRARHIRNGVELPPLSEDKNYDFNFQETRTLKQERVIRRGDSLISECVFDSSERTNVTYGGLSTHNEMCLSFIWYYPRTPLSSCMSRYIYKLPVEYTSKNATVQDLVNQQDWTKPDVRNKFDTMITSSNIISVCHGDTSDLKWNAKTEPQPNITSEYHEPHVCPRT